MDTVLANAIFKEGLRITAAGVNPVQLTSGMQRCVHDIIENLKSNSIPIREQAAMAQVASIAANNNREIGNLIAETINHVGEQGVVVIEEGKSLIDEVEYMEGMQFDNGYLTTTVARSIRCDLWPLKQLATFFMTTMASFPILNRQLNRWLLTIRLSFELAQSLLVCQS